MEFFHVLIVLPLKVMLNKIDSDKTEYCFNLQCEDGGNKSVCGVREENEGVRLRLFENECELLKYGCQVEEQHAYGLINMEHCKQIIPNETAENNTEDVCPDFDCSYPTDSKEVCGIRRDGSGFRIKLFRNKCHLIKYNCVRKLEFEISERFICNDLTISNDDISDSYKNTEDRNKKGVLPKHLIVVDSSMLDIKGDVNDTIDNFFAATHILDLPIRDVREDINETTRRMMLRIFSPLIVFKPWITIPKNISDDYQHAPTLSTCYHTCPKILVHQKCPDTYAPVCGVPGIVAREPSLMFQNHCYMDVAQCKMYWEDKSSTSQSSSYVESSFLFCLGDEMNGLYRFLPLLRTLQHMGRLKNKGHFRYKMKNMRFFNNYLSREPKLMG